MTNLKIWITVLALVVAIHTVNASWFFAKSEKDAPKQVEKGSISNGDATKPKSLTAIKSLTEQVSHLHIDGDHVKSMKRKTVKEAVQHNTPSYFNPWRLIYGAQGSQKVETETNNQIETVKDGQSSDDNDNGDNDDDNENGDNDDNEDDDNDDNDNSSSDKDSFDKESNLSSDKNESLPNVALTTGERESLPNLASIIDTNFSFEDIGIGGLSDELTAILRRVFTSRIAPPDIINGLGMAHVKGIILYGPSGTGKTLIARQISKMLPSQVPPKIVSGPEILNKYVGQSEKNIRDLFVDAEKEYRSKGDASQLHVIIFDEIDAICRKRGMEAAGSKLNYGDTVVNQLLAKMDGIEPLNNILLIGTTNRLDVIDEALLRPGRFEVKMEIGLPDSKGRLEILKIHTVKMVKNRYLDTDVRLPEIADRARNYTGSELAGLVRSATSFALERHVRGRNGDGALKVSVDDFSKAFKEVPSAYGASEEELLRCIPNGIIKHDPSVDAILAKAQRTVQMVVKSQAVVHTLLLHGPRKTGKTALAAKIALDWTISASRTRRGSQTRRHQTGLCRCTSVSSIPDPLG